MLAGRADRLRRRPRPVVPQLRARSRGATATRRSSSSTSPRWSRSCATGSPATRTSRSCSATSARASTRTATASTVTARDLTDDTLRPARGLRDRRRRRVQPDPDRGWTSGSRGAPTTTGGSSSTPRSSGAGTRVDRLRFHCNPARPAVDCPTPLGHHRWEFPVLPGEDEPTRWSATRYIWGCWPVTASEPDHVEVLRAVVYNHHVRFADRWRVGRVFLAGDAAHVDAAVDRPGHGLGRARRGQPVLEARRGAARRAVR